MQRNLSEVEKVISVVEEGVKNFNLGERPQIELTDSIRQKVVSTFGKDWDGLAVSFRFLSERLYVELSPFSDCGWEDVLTTGQLYGAWVYLTEDEDGNAEENFDRVVRDIKVLCKSFRFDPTRPGRVLSKNVVAILKTPTKFKSIFIIKNGNLCIDSTEQKFLNGYLPTTHCPEHARLEETCIRCKHVMHIVEHFLK